MPQALQLATTATAVSAEDSRRVAARNDLEFIDRLLSHEKAAWDEFLRRFGRLIAARAAATLREVGHDGCGPILEDCCSETIAALLANDMATLRRFEARSKFSTWLAVIARRVTLRHWQQWKRQQPARHGDSHFEMAVFSPGDETSASVEHQSVEAARHLLSESDQRVLSLFYDKSLSYREVAEQMKITVNAVGPKLQRAQKRLRKILEQQDAPTPPRTRKERRP